MTKTIDKQFQIPVTESQPNKMICTCELTLAQIQMQRATTVYIVWRKGKKFTQSNRYQLFGKLIEPKETLILNLKVDGNEQGLKKKLTHLYLFDKNGKELHSGKLNISQLKTQYNDIKIQFHGGRLLLKGKLKLSPQFDYFKRLRFDLEQSSEEEEQIQEQNDRPLEKAQIRLEIEVGDLAYLNERLKSQRYFALCRVQDLEKQLQTIYQKVVIDYKKIQDYYTTKIQQRESIYKQQIQQVVSFFNRNYGKNRDLLKFLIQSLFEADKQLLKTKAGHQKYIEQQEISYNNAINQLQNDKKQLENALTACKQEVNKKKEELSIVNIDFSQIKAQFAVISNLYDKQAAQKNDLMLTHQQQVQKQMVKTNQIMEEIAILKLNLQKKELIINDRAKQLEQTEHQMKVLHEDKIILENANMKLKVESHQIELEHIKMKDMLEEKQRQIDFNMEIIDQLKDQNAKTIQEYKYHNENVEKLWLEKQQNLNSQIHSLKKAINDLYQQSTVMNSKITSLEQTLNEKTKEIILLESQKDGLNELVKKLQQQAIANSNQLKVQQQLANQKLMQIMTKNFQLQSEVNNLQAQIEVLTDTKIRLQEKISLQQHSFQDIIEQNKKIFEDELQFEKNSRKEQLALFESIKLEYQKQIDGILARQKADSEQMEKQFKEQIQLKNKESLELLARNKELSEAYTMLKLKMESEALLKANARDQAYQFQILEEQSEEEQANPTAVDPVQSYQDEYNSFRSERKNRESIANLFKNSSNSFQQKPKMKTPVQRTSIKTQQIEAIEKKVESPLKEVSEEVISSNSEKQITYQVNSQSKEMNGNNKTVQKNIAKEEENNLRSNHNKRQKITRKKSVVFQEPKSQRNIIINKRNEELEAQIIGMREKLQQMEKELMKKENQQKSKLLSAIAEIEQKEQIIQEQLEKIQLLETKQISAFNDKKKQVQLQKQKRKSNNSDKSNNTQRAKRKLKLDPESITVHIAPTKNRDLPREKERQAQIEITTKRSKKPYKQQDKIHKQLQNTNEVLLQKITRLEEQLAEKTQQQIIQQKIIKTYETQIREKQLNIASQIQSQSISSPRVRKQIHRVEEKLLGEKDNAHRLKLQLNESNYSLSQLKFQLSELQKQNSQLKEMQKKQSTTLRSIRQYENQNSQLSQQIFEISRTMNILKIENTNFIDQIQTSKLKISKMESRLIDYEGKIATLTYENLNLTIQEQSQKRQSQIKIEQIQNLKQKIKIKTKELQDAMQTQTELRLQLKAKNEQLQKQKSSFLEQQFQSTKLMKELYKYYKKSQNDDQQIQKLTEQVRKQNHNLQQSLSERQKQRKQDLQRITDLRQILDNTIQQNKKQTEETKKAYTTKLKYCFEQITKVQTALEEYASEKKRLEIQNSEFFDQNEILKNSYERLEMQYNEEVEREQALINQVNFYNQEIEKLKEKNIALENASRKMQSEITSLKQQLEEAKTEAENKIQAIRTLKQLNERQTYSLKNLQKKLLQKQSKESATTQLAERCKQFEQYISVLEGELKALRTQFNEHKNMFVYQQSEVQTEFARIKQQKQSILTKEIARITEELRAKHSKKQQQLENEIINLLKQNGIMKQVSNKNNEFTHEKNHLLLQLEAITNQKKELQQQKTTLEKMVLEKNNEINSLKYSKSIIEQKFKQLTQLEQKTSAQFTQLNNKYRQYQQKAVKTERIANQYRQQYNKMAKKMKAQQSLRDEQIQRQVQQNNRCKNKILSLELEVHRLKQNQIAKNQSYQSRIEKVQKEREDVKTATLQQLAKMRKYYEKQMEKLKLSMMSFDEQLQAKTIRNEQLINQLSILQAENDKLGQNIMKAQAKVKEVSQLYDEELRILSQKLQETGQASSRTIRALEEELSIKTKEYFALKYDSENKSKSSRLLDNDDRSLRRIQDKVKAKDKQIDELKQNITLLQTAIEQLTQKQMKASDSKEYQQTIHNLTSQNRKLKETAILLEKQNYSLREQLEKLKVNIAGKQALIERNNLQLASLRSQVQQTNTLYNGLIREMHNQNKEKQSVQAATLKKQLASSKLIADQAQKESFSKKNELKQIIWQNQSLKKQNAKLTKELMEIENKYKNSVEQLEKLTFENRKRARQAEQALMTFSQQKAQLNFKNSEIAKYRDQLIAKLKDKSHQLSQIQEYLSKTEKRVNELQNHLRVNDSEHRIESEEVQQELVLKQTQLNFLRENNQNLLSAINQYKVQISTLKKENYQYELKLQQSELLDQQFSDLKLFCEKLSQQKNRAVFREEAIKMKLENLNQYCTTQQPIETTILSNKITELFRSYT